MATVTTTTETSNGGRVRSRSLKWANTLSNNIYNVLGSTPTTQGCPDETAQGRPKRKEPTIRRVCSDSLVFPQLDVSDIPSGQPFQPVVRQRSQRKPPPPMPTGEHSAAARSRLRHKAERRGSRSSTRRPELNPTQSLRSSRRHSSVSQEVVPKIMSPNNSPAQKQKLHRSLSSPQAFGNTAVGTADIRKLIINDRKSLPPPIKLPAIPASPQSPIFTDPWLGDNDQCLKRNAIYISRRTGVLVDLVSPKTCFPKPMALMPPLKASPETFLNSISATRKKRDVAHIPASAKWYLWHIFVDERAPLVLTNIQVDRRPSTSNGASWILDTPTPRMKGMPTIQEVKSRQHSREWFNDGLYGRRKYDRDSGYWGWSGSLL